MSAHFGPLPVYVPADRATPDPGATADWEALVKVSPDTPATIAAVDTLMDWTLKLLGQCHRRDEELARRIEEVAARLDALTRDLIGEPRAQPNDQRGDHDAA